MAFEQQKKMIQKSLIFQGQYFNINIFFTHFFFGNSKFTVNELTTFNVTLKNKETTIFFPHILSTLTDHRKIAKCFT